MIPILITFDRWRCGTLIFVPLAFSVSGYRIYWFFVSGSFYCYDVMLLVFFLIFAPTSASVSFVSFGDVSSEMFSIKAF